MKKQLLYFIVFTFLTACLAEQDNPLLVASCTDRIKNQNETGIDCGGVCRECEPEPEPVTVPCKSSLVNNRITLDGIHKTLTSSDFYCAQQTDFYEVFMYKDAQELVIKIYDTTLPMGTTAFPLVPYYDEEEGSASIKLNSFYNYNSLQGQLYVTRTNSSITVEVCGVDLVGQGGSFEFSGRFLCN
ncbi:MAG TPA: hypothetical protein VGD40_13935 [Chryseosolibacter sp.]